MVWKAVWILSASVYVNLNMHNLIVMCSKEHMYHNIWHETYGQIMTSKIYINHIICLVSVDISI